MAEPGLPQPDNFFDDGDDNILARMEPGEKPEDYGLLEADEHDIEARIRADQEQNQIASRASLDDPNSMDIRLTGKPGVSTTSAPRSLYQSQNTGPKGVKRDYEIAKRNLQADKRFDAMRAQRAFDRLSGQMTQFYITEQSNNEQKAGTEQNKQKFAESSDSEDSIFGRDDDGFESEEERIFEKMKKDRIAAIQNSLPVFGDYYRVDSFEDYATVIKNSHELTVTVAHVYQNYVPACQSLHLTFEAIASQFPHVCFVRVRSDVLFKDRPYSVKGLPTLLLYRGEDLFHSSVPATTEAFRGEIDPHPKVVVQWLADKGCLRLPTGGLDSLQFKDVQSIKALAEDRELDGNEYLEKGIKAAGNRPITSKLKGILRKGFEYIVADDSEKTPNDEFSKLNGHIDTDADADADAGDDADEEDDEN